MVNLETWRRAWRRNQPLNDATFPDVASSVASSDATFPSRLWLARNVASGFDATFPSDFGYLGTLMPRVWVARIELERVLFPLEKARVEAFSEPKSQGPRRHKTPRFGRF